jgi:predicted metal-dependent peptidase
MTNIEKIISASMLRLRMKSPFFATLALFAHIRVTERCPTAATDGKDIFVNAEFVRSLSSPQVDGLLLHEVLHAALLHVPRRGTREPVLWNIAADVVVNGMIARQAGFELPANGIRDEKLEHLSAEEIYELLLKDSKAFLNSPNDLLYEPLDKNYSDNSSARDKNYSVNSSARDGNSSDSSSARDKNYSVNSSAIDEARRAALESHWRNAMQQALAVARTSNSQGSVPPGMERELASVTLAQLDWRSYLWRYLVRTPTDFTGFDRRFIGQRLYLEALEGESVKVYVAVDTSGSVGTEELQLFLSEVAGILSAYPHIKCKLYYVDAAVYGPYDLTTDSAIPQPVGGGGTSFVPFFEKVEARHDTSLHSNGVCVYLTDGYGDFPPQPPNLPVLWVVTPGGLDLGGFPFGEAVRLLSQ